MLDIVKPPNPSGFHHIEISRDVEFDEETTLKKSRRSQLEEVHEEDVPPRKVEVEPSHEIVASEDHDILELKKTLLWIYIEREKNQIGSFRKQGNICWIL